MSQNSKIMPVRANTILEEIFATGHTIALFKSDPNTGVYTQPTSCKSYKKYEIKNGDFSANNGEITTTNHLLYGLATEEWASEEEPILAFGVYNIMNTLLYWGMLTTPVPVPEDTVPVFKIYNEEKGEGIKVTLDVAATAAASS